MTFDQWFKAEGFDEQHRSVLAKAWDAALENAKKDLDNEWHWLLNNLKA